MTAKTLAAGIAFAAALHDAHAGRPFVTDDARVVDRGHCQLETFYKKQRADSGSELWVLPACNPALGPFESGIELTVGANRVEGEHNLILQVKTLLKNLETNGAGFALSVGSDGGDPSITGIASFSYLDDRAVIHANLGAIRSGATWGVGLEALLAAPRLYGILETFGERGEGPTRHIGLRLWVIPNRFQIDATAGRQSSLPERRFNSVGLRLLF